MTEAELERGENAPRAEAPPRALDWRTKLGYAPAVLTETLAVNSVTQLVNPVFAIGLGLNPAWVGIAMSVPRIWDAFTNPIVGSISDNWRSRWGRRRPFILVGAILTAVALAGLWWFPAGRSATFYFAWLLVGGILLTTALDIFLVPYHALGLELAERRQDCTALMAWRSMFAKIGGIAVQWLFAVVQLPFFADAAQGARRVGVVVGAFVLGVGSMPAFLLRERIDLKRHPPPQIPLLASWHYVLRDRNFLLLSAANICIYSSFLLVETLGLYLNIYYVCGGDLTEAGFLKGISGTAFHLAGIATLPAIAWMAKRQGKRRTLAVSTAFVVLGGVAKWFCYFPGASWWVVVPSILLGPGFAAVLVLVPSILADLCAQDERATGARREGMYSAVLTWIFKLVNSGVLFLSGLILVFAGWENSLGEAQSPTTFAAMRACFSGVTVIVALAAVLLLQRCRVEEVRGSSGAP